MPKTNRRTEGQSSQTRKPPQSNFKAKVFLTVLLGLVALLITWASHYHYSDIQQYLLFNDSNFKKSADQIKMVTALSFQISIFILSNVFFMFVLTTLLGLNYENTFVIAVRRNIGNTLEQFFIFLGLFGYILTQGKFQFKDSQLILISNWFLVARYCYGVGSVLEALTGFNWRQLGTVMGLIALVTMVLQIAGMQPFVLVQI